MKRIILSALFGLACLSASASEEAFIGELTTPESGLSFTSFSRISRTDKAAAAEFKWGSPYLMDIATIYDGGVDLVFEFSENCFLDHVCIDISGNCQGAMVQAFCGDTAICPATLLNEGKNVIVPAWKGKGFKLRFYKDIGYLETASIEVIKKEYNNFTINEVHLFGASRLENVIYPMPQELEYTGGYLENISGVTAPKKEFAADNFIEKYSERFGRQLPRKGGNINFSIDKSMEKEAFTINVGKEGAELKGGSSRALLYASEKLLQLADEQGHLKCARIDDSPAYPIRGIHFGIPIREDWDFLKRMVKYVYMPMGYNTFFFEIGGSMEYKRHPEINEAWAKEKSLHGGMRGGEIISQKEIAGLCSYFRKYGFDVIPLVQSFGHAQYITLSHPELAEQVEVKDEKADLLVADQRASAKYFHTCCPNHKDYFPLVFDILDEVIDVVKPDGYVNIGHDEIYELGQCPLCKAEGGANVYAREVNTLYDYLKKKGYGTMMWSDMITEKKYASTASIDVIPKDIICLPFTWYFHLAEDSDSEQALVDHGFSYLIGNLYSSHFPRYDQRRDNPGFLGGEVSIWQKGDEIHYGYQGKMYDFTYSALMLWNKCYADNFRRTYNEIVREFLPQIRERIHFDNYEQDVVFKQFTPSQEIVPYDMTNNFKTAEYAGAGKDARIEMGVKADRIHIVHATDYQAVEGVMTRAIPEPSGAYILEYEDGTTASEPMWYGYNLGGCYKWAFGAPRRSRVFRHYGYGFTYPCRGISLKTWEGKDATVWDYAIDNPYPGKTVKAVRIQFDGKNASRMLIFRVEAGKIQ